MTSKKERDRQIAEALRRSTDGVDADVSHLVRAVPSMIAEARMRAARPVDPLAALDESLRAWVPRLAAATLVPVVLAAIVLFSDTGTVTSTASEESLDRLILTGGYTESGGEAVSDPVFEALLGDSENHG